MTNRNKASLTALFQTGDIPIGQDYADLIDSNVNLVETAVQTMAGPLSTTELITSRLSATNLAVGGNNFLVSAINLIQFANGGSFSVSAGGSVNLNNLGNFTINTASNFTVSAGGTVALRDTTGNTISMGASFLLTSNGTMTLTAQNGSTINVSAGAISLRCPTTLTSGSFITQAPVIISAAGTAQATAALLTSVINRGKGVVDGSTTGFRPLANKAGLVQYLYNEGPSANLWPPVGGTINGLAANAPLPLATSAMVTIVHLTASAMAVG